MGAPGVGGGPSQPMTMRESESQAFVEVTKKYVMAMVKDTYAEVVPFTQTGEDTFLKYRSESNKPTLQPLMYLRLSGAEDKTVDDDSWKPIYQELFDALPNHIKEWLTWESNLPFADRDPSFVTVQNLLTTTAKGLAWLAQVTKPIRPNSPEEIDYVQSVALPFVALKGSLEQATSSIEHVQDWLEAEGPNYPHYDSLTDILNQANVSLNELKRLEGGLKEGEITPEVRQHFALAAEQLNQLCQTYNSSHLKEELGIVGAQLEALKTVAEAWALSFGSPSLLIGTTIATNSLDADASETGPLGKTANKALEALLEGILSSVALGPRAELNDLTTLRNNLAELRSQS